MKNVQKNKYIIIFCLTVSSLFIQSCKSNSDNLPTEPPASSRGQIVSSVSLGINDVKSLQSYINQQLSSQQLSVTLVYSVLIYKLVYKTVDPSGNTVTASGIVCIPQGKNNLSLMSVHHGTQSNRLRAASVNPFNSPEGIIAAALGYYAVMPDYLGLGESTLMHPYHLAKPSADVVIDMIRAAREFANNSGIILNGQVFLAGYSEGGYVTLAAHKEIQQNYNNEIRVTASAPMAGAYDINLTAKKIIQNKIYNQPSYLAFFFAAYNYYYGWNKLSDYFNSPYADRIPTLFDGTKSTDEINFQLTNDINLLFKSNFVNSYLNGSEITVTSAFDNNSLLNWTPAVPIKFYHGSADEYVPYENSVKARDTFLSRGANVELITIQGGTHLTAALPSIISAINWFEQIRLKKLSLAQH